MRDVIVLALTAGGAFAGFVRPWIGVLVLAVFAYLNPHRYAWGFTLSMPVYLIVFLGTLCGLVLNGQDRQRFPWTRETVLFVSLLAWFTLTTFLSPDFPDAARQQWMKVMKVYIGIFPTLWLITTRERLRWLMIVIAFSFGIIGVKGGVFALATGFKYRVWGPDSTFYDGNNEIALALNMILPLVLLIARETDNRKLQLCCYATFGLSICSIISSWSRGGLLTLCVVLTCIILNGRRKWLSIPLVLLVVLFAVPNLPEKWFERMHTIKTYDADASAMGRIDAWNFALDRATAHPVTGGGFMAFLANPSGLNAHSGYFLILGEHGLIGLLLWVSLLFGTLIALERLRSQALAYAGAGWLRDYARAFQISLLGFAVGGAFLNVAYWDIFYHLVALCVVLKVLLHQEAAAATPEFAFFSRAPEAVGEPLPAPGGAAGGAAGRPGFGGC